MRKRGKTDANQDAIVQALRAIPNCHVLSLAALGNGVPDLLVCYRLRLHLLEIKDGSKPPSKRRLTPDQVAFHSIWPVTVVENEQQALQAMGLPHAR